ncbi:MAG: HEAT repeat domain-containing protein, partial [Prochlorococcaceae cyanobacterium]
MTSGPYPEQSPQELYLDPDVLAQELAQELLGDPLDELDSSEPAPGVVAAECDRGLELLRRGDPSAGHEALMQGLRVFC